MEAERVYKDLLWQDPDRMSGAVCFYGTRIRLQDLFDHLDGGATLVEFCRTFRLPETQVKAVLALAEKSLESTLWNSKAA